MCFQISNFRLALQTYLGICHCPIWNVIFCWVCNNICSLIIIIGNCFQNFWLKFFLSFFFPIDYCLIIYLITAKKALAHILHVSVKTQHETDLDSLYCVQANQLWPVWVVQHANYNDSLHEDTSYLLKPWSMEMWQREG